MDDRHAPPTFRLLPLVAACFAASTVHATPLSHVQRVGQDDAGPAGIDRSIRFVLDGDRLFGASNDTILHFERDPVTGRLSFVEEIVRFESGEPVAAQGDLRPRLALTPLPDGRLAVSTQARTAETCPDGPTAGCGTNGTTTFEIDDGGRLAKIGSDEVGALFPFMRTSPDGRHVYSSTSGFALAALAVDANGRLSPLESYDSFRADGTLSNLTDLVIAPDGEFVYALASSGTTSTTRHTISTLARDAATGRLVPISDAEVGPDAFGLEAETSFEIAISPDGTAIYASARSPTDGAGVGLARFDVSAAGTVTFAGIAATDPEPVPPVTSRIQSLAVGAGGRLVAIAENDSPTERQLLYLFTVDDAGDTIFRGAEAALSDGVIDGDLRSVAQLEFSDDGAFLYTFANHPDSIGFNVFAAHADLQVGIDAPVNALAGDVVGTTVRLVNAGPATSHGLSVTIEASGDILGADGDCDIDGALATCRVDELLARGAAEIPVRLRAPQAGPATLSVDATQYQTDLDASSNAASASVPTVAEAGQVSGTTATVGAEASSPVATGEEDAPADRAGASSGDDGGGCSIATGDGREPLLAWLVVASMLGLRRRVKRSGA